MEALILSILSFLGMNFLIFIPSWVIGKFSKINHKPKSFFDDSFYFIFKKLLYQRFSDDCFRLILELQVLTFLVMITNHHNVTFLKVLFNICIILSFIYVTYISVIIKIFKKEPMLINDIDFAKTGVMVYKKKIPLVLFSIIATLVLVSILGYFLSELLIENITKIDYKWPLIVLLLLSILLSFISIRKVKYDIYHSCVSFSVLNHLLYNIKKCNTLKKNLKTLNNHKPYAYTEKLKLQKPPNIIFVFLESYGSFVFSEPIYGKEFKKKMDLIHKSLTRNNYHAVSTLSESPVSSGGSWLSHSSVLFGAKVKDIAAHEIIFNQTDYVSKLESLPKYLSSQGYNTVLTTTLSYHKNEINWEKVYNAYPFNNMMLHGDFEFSGKKVNIHGDTMTLPDEYTLNYAYTSVKSEPPFFLCVNAINSHHKFVSPTRTLDHWQDYNTTDYELTDGLTKHNLKNYFTAIHYQLDYIHQFLLKQNPEETVMVLIGDHQPPFVTPANIDKATPIHIISKNRDFIEAFKEFNYTKGLFCDVINQKHESFFSKVLYVLNQVYGVNNEIETPIFEDGIHLY